MLFPSYTRLSLVDIIRANDIKLKRIKWTA